MKPRTSQAKLLRFEEQDGTKIEVTYAPAENMLMFRTIHGRILPTGVPIKEIWNALGRPKWIEAMQRAEMQAREPEAEDPRQIEHQVILEACQVAAQVPDEVLPTHGVEVVQEPVVCEMQGAEVAREEPPPVFVQEPPQPSEAARPPVPFKLRRISDILPPNGLRQIEGQAQQVA